MMPDTLDVARTLLAAFDAGARFLNLDLDSSLSVTERLRLVLQIWT